MKVTVQVVMESENGDTKVVQEVAQIERHSLQSATLGLNLKEAKTLLQGVQHAFAQQQIQEYLQQQSACEDCGQKRYRKDERDIIYRTLFGRLRLRSPRLYHCQCQPQPTRTFSPLTKLRSREDRTRTIVSRVEVRLPDVLWSDHKVAGGSTAIGGRS